MGTYVTASRVKQALKNNRIISASDRTWGFSLEWKMGSHGAVMLVYQ